MQTLIDTLHLLLYTESCHEINVCIGYSLMEIRNWICILNTQVDFMDGRITQKIRQHSIRINLKVKNQKTGLNTRLSSGVGFLFTKNRL